MPTRLSAFRNKLEEESIDAALLVKPHNVFYFAGYSSVCSGVVIFPDAEPIFCTLWMDAPEAKTLCWLPRMATYRFPADSLMGRMIKLVSKKKPSPSRIGIEKDFMLVRDYQRLLTAFPKAELMHVSPIVDRLRAIKSEQELENIRKSAWIADQAMAAALNAVAPGITEIDVAAEAEYAMRRLGSERTAFGTFVASGPRTLLAHPHATRRIINPGEPVVIDLGATWEGYASDICRTTFAGEPSRAQRRHLQIVVEAQRAAAAELRDGVPAGNVFDAVYKVFKTYKMANLLPDDIGYGLGLRQSEFFPIIERNSETVLRQNMVVALLQTTVSKRNIGGLRVEDTFHVTKNGFEKLTAQVQPFL